jgi:chitin disaccharide deacetylase
VTALLIVSADDLGLTAGVCRAVLQAHLHGVATAASLLAVGRSFELAAHMLRDHPALDAGGHLAIVGEDPPLLSAREIPTLVDKRGAFPLSYRTVVARGLVGRLNPEDVRREFAAQLERMTAAGVRLSHLDTHQHTHLWPPVAAAVVALAAEHRIPAVRLPRSNRLLPVGVGVNVLARGLRAKLGRRGLVTTDAYAGLDEAGSFDRHRFERRMSTLDAKRRAGTIDTVEINTHPGELDDPELGRFGWGYRWAEELAMLQAPGTRERVERAGWQLGSFTDLAARRSGP